MSNSSIIRGAVLAAAVWVALGLLRFKPWQRADASGGERQRLTVGFLPVT